MANEGGTRFLRDRIRFSVDSTGCASDSASNQNNDLPFLGAVGRVADIEALNSSTKGLDIIAKTAAAGGPTLSRLIDAGGQGVLNTVLAPAGMNSQQVLGGVNRVNPSAVNRATFASNEIADRLASDDFSVEDIPTYTRDFANLIKIGAKMIVGGASDQINPVCSAPNYAQDLVNFGVKQNYRFIVQFEFNEPYAQSLGQLNHAFVVKTCERPGVQFEYEDINMYNFRTRARRKTIYNPVSMTFYDDQISQALNFYVGYLRVMSPIANVGPRDGKWYEEFGMDFPEFSNDSFNLQSAQQQVPVYNYAASMGPLDTVDGIDIIKSVKIFHLYRGGGIADVHTLSNPKILEMSIDELSSEGGSPGLVTFQFGYDAAFMETYQATEDLGFEEINKGGKTLEPTHTISTDFLVLPSGAFAQPARVDTTSGGTSNSSTQKQASDDQKNFLQRVTDAVTDVQGDLSSTADKVIDSVSQGLFNRDK